MKLKLSILLAFVLAGFTGGVANAASPLGTYPNCAAGAVPYETQAWWSPMAGAPMPEQPGHVHLGACLPPLYSTISQPVQIDAVVQLHNNPSEFVNTRWSDGSDVIENAKSSFKCPTHHCERVVPLLLDPAKFKAGGYREVRFTADVRTQDQKRMYNTTRWCFNIANGKKASNYCGPPGAKERTGTAGWYTGLEYLNVYTKWADIQPTPKSGTWKVQVQFQKPTGKGTFMEPYAAVDPSFHADPPNFGTIIPTQNTTAWQTISIDTTKFTNGWHRLLLKTEARGSSPVGVGSGLFAVWFQVAN